MFSKKPGFTIVELLMVVGIIGILLGIVTTAASSSMKAARTRKADALCRIVQSGIATYYAQTGAYPDNSITKQEPNCDYDGDGVDESYRLTSGQVRETVRKMVQRAAEGSPVLDISALFVSSKAGEKGGERAIGMDFWTAVRGARKTSPKKLTLSQMYFGYPDKETGRFLRFNMIYSPGADAIVVGQQ